MATLYFNAAVDNTWNNLSNWWQDSAFTIPAVAIPTAGDTVYIEANVTTGPTAAITLAALYIAQINNAVTLGSSGAGISTTGNLTVGKGTYLNGYISGANLTIGGTATLYYGYLESTLTVGLANFYGYSENISGGLVTGNAIFNNSSENNSTIGGDATFNDSSVNGSGIVTGNATFNDSAYNYYYATVTGNATFNNNSLNYGTVSGNASVYYPVTRPLGGTVAGTITYFGYPYFYFNAAADGTWDNHLNWWRDSAFSVPAGAIPAKNSTVFIEANLTTGPSVAITLAALYIAQINNAVTLGSSGAGISTTGNLTVGVGSSLYGRINSANLTIGGTASFYGSNGGNSSTITVGSANFYQGSSNYGTGQGSASNGVITGSAIFQDNSKNYCSIGGGATFNDFSSNNSGGHVMDGAIFNNSSYNASGGSVVGGATFNDSSYNASGATVDGTATFYSSSYNNGLVSGNANVYSPVIKPLGGSVTGTITYIGYSTLYFNAAADGTWNNLSNWWRDSAFTVRASALPANGDTVYVEANLTAGPTAAITLNALYVAQIKNGATLGNSGAGISTTGNLTVGSGTYLYGRINSANLTIGGTAFFYGSNGGNSSTITVGLANFYLGSSNYGTNQGSASNGVITGNVVFHDNSKNFCSIGGGATFNDFSGNNSGGHITGSAAFSDSSYNASGGTVGGNASFRNGSSNSGQISGNASVYYPVGKPINGIVMGTITYFNYS